MLKDESVVRLRGHEPLTAGAARFRVAVRPGPFLIRILLMLFGRSTVKPAAGVGIDFYIEFLLFYNWNIRFASV